MTEEMWTRLIYLTLLLAAVGGWLMVEFRQRLGQTLRLLVAWGLIFLGVIAAAGLWNDVRPNLMPRQAVMEGGAIEVPRADDGHFYLTLVINGTPVRFVADTGASNMVLTIEDAARLGIDPASLVYLGQARTANGTVRTARVTLPQVELGPYVDTDFPAWVNEGEMFGSLLGMEYLRLYRVEIDGDRMILRR
jgi:aspartyl protease family protein